MYVVTSSCIPCALLLFGRFDMRRVGCYYCEAIDSASGNVLGRITDDH
jgi:hypothetical protein